MREAGEVAEVDEVGQGAVRVPLLRLDPDLPLPAYAHPGDAGADLVAREGAVLAPGGGRALRHGVTCLNTPGLIDAGYRDELRVLLVNTDPAAPYEVSRGDRIAQLVIQRVEKARFVTVAELPTSERGTGGFGHTGR